MPKPRWLRACRELSNDHQGNAEFTRLPRELLDQLTKPFARFLAIEAAAGAVLLLFTIAALVLANSPWAHSFLDAWETQISFQIGAWELARSLRDWINDGLMTFFHATITGVILGLMTPARRWVSDDRLYAILTQVIAHPLGDEGSGDTKNR